MNAGKGKSPIQVASGERDRQKQVCGTLKDPELRQEYRQFMDGQHINGIHCCFLPLDFFSIGNLAGEFQS